MLCNFSNDHNAVFLSRKALPMTETELRLIWVGLFFMMTAITIYVMSNDLSFFPRGQPPPLSDGARR